MHWTSRRIESYLIQQGTGYGESCKLSVLRHLRAGLHQGLEDQIQHPALEVLSSSMATRYKAPKCSSSVRASCKHTINRRRRFLSLLSTSNRPIITFMRVSWHRDHNGRRTHPRNLAVPSLTALLATRLIASDYAEHVGPLIYDRRGCDWSLVVGVLRQFLGITEFQYPARGGQMRDPGHYVHPLRSFSQGYSVLMIHPLTLHEACRQLVFLRVII